MNSFPKLLWIQCTLLVSLVIVVNCSNPSSLYFTPTPMSEESFNAWYVSARSSHAESENRSSTHEHSENGDSTTQKSISDEFDDLKKKVTEAGIINNVLIPQEEIGRGMNGIVWRGILLEKRGNITHKRQVAIKIDIYEDAMKQECERIIELRQGNERPEDMEKLGIPALYYNGTFHEYSVMAFTLLGSNLYDHFLKNGPLQSENQLRYFYQLVQILQYMHNKNIIHNDMKPDNIVYRDGQIFVIDFDLAQNLVTRKYEDKYGGSIVCSSPAFLYKLDRFRMDDVKSLFYIMVSLDNVLLPWDKIDEHENNIFSLEEIGKMKLNRQIALDLCDKLRSSPLKTVVKYLHDTVLEPYPDHPDLIEEDTRTPDYRGLLDKALEGIEEVSGTKDTSVNWLLEEVIRYPKFNTNEAAEEHLRKSSTFSRIIPKIGRIFNPNFELMHEINKFAINKEKMMDRLQPLRNKNLWINRESFFWQGKLFERKASKNGKDVEIKASKEVKWLDREYKIYKMMGAVNNEDIEMYGIQSAYAYVEFSRYYSAIAFTLCPEQLIERIGKISSLNILRVLYQAILTLKFVHGKGFVHKNLTPNDFLIRGSRLFISGFEYAELNRIRYQNYSISDYRFGAECATLSVYPSYMDDLKSLYYIILHFLEITLPWGEVLDFNEIAKFKMMYAANRNLCSNIKDPVVRKVILEYYKEVMVAYPDENDTGSVQIDFRIPDYDKLGELVMKGIQDVDKVKSLPKNSKPRNAHFDWPSNLPKIKMPSFDLIKGPPKLNRIEAQGKELLPMKF